MKESFLGPLTALSAMAVALVAAIAGRPHEAVAVAPSWTATVESGGDHITPRELADRLLEDATSVWIVDVRPAAEFAAFHLPDAVNLDLTELLGERGRTLLAENRGKLLVLCSNGMTHPAQAWVELAREDRGDVRVLEDGLDGFVRDVLTPPSLRAGTSSESLGAEQARFAAARAAFLGPQVGQDPRLAAAAKPAPATDGSSAVHVGEATPAVQVPSASPAVQASGASPAAQAVEKPAFARLATDPLVLAQPTIVSAAWLARRSASIVVLDAREKREDYAAGHVPGAHHVAIQALRFEREGVPDELLPIDKLAALFGALGIDADTEVVAYGETKLQDPAHLALALIRIGHRPVAILEGGLAAWKSSGQALSKDVPVATPKTYVPREGQDVRVAKLADVERAAKDRKTRILDVRPADAFRGDVSTEARAGHIPGSWNRPYTADLAVTEAGPFWRPVDDLRREYEALGLGRKDPVIVTCRTGHQAAQTWFTLRYVLGYEDVSWYDGSWKEWAGHPELPAETGAGSK